MKNTKELETKIEDLEAKIADLLDQRAAVDAEKVRINEKLGIILFEGKLNENLENDLARCTVRVAPLDAAIKHGRDELAKARGELFEAERSEVRRAALDEMEGMEVELNETLHAVATTAGKIQNWGDRLRAIDALAKTYGLTDVHAIFSILYSSIPFEALRGINSQMGSNAVFSRNKKR